MSTITFLCTEIETKMIKCNLKEKMKEVCKRYAKEVNKNYKQLVFFSDGEKLNKKISVNEFNELNPEKELFVVIMDKNVDSDSDEEKIKTAKLKEEFLDCIKNPNKEITYEKTQELITKYGYDCKKRIKKEKKEHPENFIEIKDAIKKKDTNKKLYALGQLGKSLENMGIEVAIDKTEGKNNDDSIILNQIISSGILEEKKYEIHIEEKDVNKVNAIINNKNGEQEKFIEEMKFFISKQVSIPRQDIIIENIREGCVAMDVSFKKKHGINIRQKMEELSLLKKIKKIYEKNILEACKLTLDMLDERGNRYPNEWPNSTQKRGGKNYYPPTRNWIGYGLKVLDQYDYGNNDWIAMNGNPNEWAVAFHATSIQAVEPICKNGGKFFSSIKEGAGGQKCRYLPNMNRESQKEFQICDEGTYVSPHLEYTLKYFNGVIIMCRVNPKKIRIPQGFEDSEWITDGTRNTIRPYRLLFDLNS